MNIKNTHIIIIKQMKTIIKRDDTTEIFDINKITKVLKKDNIDIWNLWRTKQVR